MNNQCRGRKVASGKTNIPFRVPVTASGRLENRHNHGDDWNAMCVRMDMWKSVTTIAGHRH